MSGALRSMVLTGPLLLRLQARIRVGLYTAILSKASLGYQFRRSIASGAYLFPAYFSILEYEFSGIVFKFRKTKS